jgi:lipoate---protein ligase
MKYTDLTLPTPEENLACDEALLNQCEEGGPEVLRCWESPLPFVVLGYGNEAAREVNLAACRERRIPVLRRCSGGGTVLQGPGCLSYSLLLPIDVAGLTGSIASTNRWIMEKHRVLFSRILEREVLVHGHTDLAAEGLKFSGNAQRRRRHFLLFHGTVLLHFDLQLVEQVLPMPSKQPPYRQDRPHLGFLQNLHLAALAVKEALRREWAAQDPLPAVPRRAIQNLVEEKYSRAEWNLRC